MFFCEKQSHAQLLLEAGMFLCIFHSHLVSFVTSLQVKETFLVWSDKPGEFGCLTLACQAPLSMGFSRQYWSRLPFPSPGNLPNPGIEPASPALTVRFLLLSPQGSQWCYPIQNHRLPVVIDPWKCNESEWRCMCTIHSGFLRCEKKKQKECKLSS